MENLQKKIISPSETLVAIDAILLELHERIISGRCLTNHMQNQLFLDLLHHIADKDEFCPKYAACRYIGISRATFDRLVIAGKLPKGKKIAGWKELIWSYRELDTYIDQYINE